MKTVDVNCLAEAANNNGKMKRMTGRAGHVAAWRSSNVSRPRPNVVTMGTPLEATSWMRYREYLLHDRYNQAVNMYCALFAVLNGIRMKCGVGLPAHVHDALLLDLESGCELRAVSNVISNLPGGPVD